MSKLCPSKSCHKVCLPAVKVEQKFTFWGGCPFSPNCEEVLNCLVSREQQQPKTCGAYITFSSNPAPLPPFDHGIKFEPRIFKKMQVFRPFFSSPSVWELWMAINQLFHVATVSYSSKKIHPPFHPFRVPQTMVFFNSQRPSTIKITNCKLIG